MNSTQPSTATPNKKTKTRRTPEQWRELIAGFEQSDLTLDKQCASQGIATSGFYQWRKRFEQEEHGSSQPAFVEMVPPIANSHSPVSPRPINGWRIELELGDGMILRLR